MPAPVITTRGGSVRQERAGKSMAGQRCLGSVARCTANGQPNLAKSRSEVHFTFLGESPGASKVAHPALWDNLLYRRFPIGRPFDLQGTPESQAGSTAIQQVVPQSGMRYLASPDSLNRDGVRSSRWQSLARRARAVPLRASSRHCCDQGQTARQYMLCSLVAQLLTFPSLSNVTVTV